MTTNNLKRNFKSCSKTQDNINFNKRYSYRNYPRAFSFLEEKDDFSKIVSFTITLLSLFLYYSFQLGTTFAFGIVDLQTVNGGQSYLGQIILITIIIGIYVMLIVVELQLLYFFEKARSFLIFIFLICFTIVFKNYIYLFAFIWNIVFTIVAKCTKFFSVRDKSTVNKLDTICRANGMILFAGLFRHLIPCTFKTFLQNEYFIIIFPLVLVFCFASLLISLTTYFLFDIRKYTKLSTRASLIKISELYKLIETFVKETKVLKTVFAVLIVAIVLFCYGCNISINRVSYSIDTEISADSHEQNKNVRVIVLENSDYYVVENGIMSVNEDGQKSLVISTDSYTWIKKEDLTLHPVNFDSVSIQ